MQSMLMALTATLLLTSRLAMGQFGGLFGQRNADATSKDTVVIGCGSNQAVFQPNGADTLNIIMDGSGSGQVMSPAKDGSASLFINNGAGSISCENGQCINQLQSNSLVPLLKNAIPVPQIPMSLPTQHLPPPPTSSQAPASGLSLPSVSAMSSILNTLSPPPTSSRGDGPPSTAAMLSLLAGELGLSKKDLREISKFENEMKEQQGKNQPGQSGPQGRVSNIPPIPSISASLAQMTAQLPPPPTPAGMMPPPPPPAPQQPPQSLAPPNPLTSASQPPVTLLPIYVPENDLSLSNLISAETTIPFHPAETIPPFANAAASLNSYTNPVAAIQALQSVPSQATAEQPFRHSPAHPLDSLNALIHGGFVSDIRKIPQPFSYDHNHGLSSQSSEHQQQRRPRPRFPFLPSFPSLWSAPSVIRNTLFTRPRQPPMPSPQFPAPPSHLPNPFASSPFSSLSSHNLHASGSAQQPHKTRFVPQFVGPKGSSISTEPSSPFGMPNIPPPVIDETGGKYESTPDSIPSILTASSEGYPIFDAKQAAVYRAPHNPVDILKIFADAYGKHSVQTTTVVHSPGGPLRSPSIPSPSPLSLLTSRFRPSSSYQGESAAASQSYPIFTKTR